MKQVYESPDMKDHIFNASLTEADSVLIIYWFPKFPRGSPAEDFLLFLWQKLCQTYYLGADFADQLLKIESLPFWDPA